MFKTLLEHQEKIRVLLDRGAVDLRTGAGPDVLSLGKARWELARLLGAYQLFKHTELFDRAIARGSPEMAALAQRMKADCIALGDDFRAHLKHWGAVSIMDNWTAYRTAALAMNRRIRAHLVTERAAAARLCADRTGAIRHAINRAAAG